MKYLGLVRKQVPKFTLGKSNVRHMFGQHYLFKFFSKASHAIHLQANATDTHTHTLAPNLKTKYVIDLAPERFWL